VTVNIDDGTMAEEWLQATLNVIPAYTWYAACAVRYLCERQSARCQWPCPAAF
jgi:hypothetical protein